MLNSTERRDTLDVLVVEDDVRVRDLLCRYISSQGHRVRSAGDGVEALELIGKSPPDLVLTDLKMPRMDGMELAAYLREHAPQVDVIVLTAYADRDSAIQALRLGVYDYLVKPLDLTELGASLRRVAERRRLMRYSETLRKKLIESRIMGHLIGISPAMQEVYRTIEKLSTSECNVLILGETGTGKELVARTIHDTSPRADGPFVVLDCGGLNENLLESELFGHVKGAFTGALYDKVGIFEQANGGTLFIDEIGVTSPSFQTRLLRVLQDGQFKKVGGTKVIRSDMRVIAATNEDLESRIKEGTFREDLYYRLNVVQIVLPPLRKRKEDIPILARYFLNQCPELEDPESVEISKEAMDALINYDWPGNVRELENVIRQAAVLSDRRVIRPEDLPERIRKVAAPTKKSFSLKEAEREHILSVLASVKGNRRRAAEMLGISERTLYRKLRKLGISSR